MNSHSVVCSFIMAHYAKRSGNIKMYFSTKQTIKLFIAKYSQGYMNFRLGKFIRLLKREKNMNFKCLSCCFLLAYLVMPDEMEELPTWDDILDLNLCV